MYQVFLGYVPLPLPPSKMTTTVGSRNTTVDLIDGREVSILKNPSLKEIAFDFLLPHQQYPFATLAGDVQGALSTFLPTGNLVNNAITTAILTYLEYLKTSKEPFYFVVARLGEAGNGLGQSALNTVHLYDSCVKVSLEDYSIEEDADAHGLDVLVSVKLKQYEDYVHTTLVDEVIKKVRP